MTAPKIKMENGKSQGNYTTETMQQMATIAQTANDLEISGNNFKVNALCGCPDMVLFACEQIKEKEQELLHTQLSMSEIQDLFGEISCFVENLDYNISGRDAAFDKCLDVGNTLRNLNIPEIV